MANNIVKVLESYQIAEVDTLLKELFSTNIIEERIDICDAIIDCLLWNDIEIDEIEDQIKDLTIQ